MATNSAALSRLSFAGTASVSAGSPDANKVVLLNGSGLIDLSCIPESIGGTGGSGGSQFLTIANNLSDLANIASAVAHLGLTIGTNVQAFNSSTTHLGNTVSGASGTLLMTDGSAASLTNFPTGTTSTTVAAGNDARFPASVTGLRKGAGAGSADVAAIAGTDYLTPSGSGTGLSGVLKVSNNLSDLGSLSSARTNLGVGAVNGIASLDGSGKVPTSQLPASIVGAVSYVSTWNASTNTPTLTSSTGTKGNFYVVATAGSTTLDGISTWNVGDWVIFNGTVWNKLDGVASEVLSVAGRTGAVTLSYSDISGLAASATTDTTNASNILSGTLGVGRLPTIPSTQISGLAASATTDTTNAANISSGTLPFARLGTGVTSTTVAIGNDTRFPASVTGLRKGAGAGSTDTAAVTSDIVGLLTGGSGTLNLASYTLTLPALTYQLRTGTASQLATITLANGEPGWTSDTHQLFIGDNSTVGGNPVVTLAASKNVYVSQSTGNNTRGVRSKYDETFPFLTIAAALTASASGDTVYIVDGTFNERNLTLKNGVNIFVGPAAVLTISSGLAANDALFTDGGSAVTCAVSGCGQLCTLNNTGGNVLSNGLVVTAASNITWSNLNLTLGTNVVGFAIYLNGANATVQVNNSTFTTSSSGSLTLFQGYSTSKVTGTGMYVNTSSGQATQCYSSGAVCTGLGSSSGSLVQADYFQPNWAQGYGSANVKGYHDITFSLPQLYTAATTFFQIGGPCQFNSFTSYPNFTYGLNVGSTSTTGYILGSNSSGSFVPQSILTIQAVKPTGDGLGSYYYNASYSTNHDYFVDQNDNVYYATQTLLADRFGALYSNLPSGSVIVSGGGGSTVGTGATRAAVKSDISTLLSAGTGSLDLSGYTLTLPALQYSFRSGSASALGSVTLAQGEPGWTTDTKSLYIGDGTTAGGNFVGNAFVIRATTSAAGSAGSVAAPSNSQTAGVAGTSTNAYVINNVAGNGGSVTSATGFGQTAAHGGNAANILISVAAGAGGNVSSTSSGSGYAGIGGNASTLMSFTAGSGGVQMQSNSFAGAGGSIPGLASVTGGNGGNGNSSSFASAGAGGSSSGYLISVVAGNGADTTASSYSGGSGGSFSSLISLTTGAGGASAAGGNGGAGGNITAALFSIASGSGSASSSTSGGAGSDAGVISVNILKAASGSAGTPGTTGRGGVGGAISTIPLSFVAGAGGNGATTFAGGAGGTAGYLALNGGFGGSASTAAGGIGGASGYIQGSGGSGGATGGVGGAGGAIVFNGGFAFNNLGGGAGGVVNVSGGNTNGVTAGSAGGSLLLAGALGIAGGTITLSNSVNTIVTSGASPVTLTLPSAAGTIDLTETSRTVVVSGTSQTAVANGIYVTNNAGVVTVTLPTTATVGDTVEINGMGAGGWLLAQNASQVIHMNSNTTTTGTGGSIASTNQWNVVKVRCVVANTTWTVIMSSGTLTVT